LSSAALLYCRILGIKKAARMGRLGRTSGDARLSNNDDRNAGLDSSELIHGSSLTPEMAFTNPLASSL